MEENSRKVLKNDRRIWIAILAIFLSVNAFAQKLTVNGQIMDSHGEAIIGASVSEKGTTNGAVSDFDGRFVLEVSQGATLSISYIGYTSQELKATANMKVTLSDNTELIDEVVVIGYGAVKRKDVTTAISSVSTKDLDERPILSVDQAIQGKAAGISVVKPNGLPGQKMTIRVRGTTSMNGSNDPLYVVDGVPMTDISFLATNDIESMQVLKDASSAAIYGSRAANGVIMITTKQGQQGKSKISFNSYLGVTNVANKIESLNLGEYREYLKDLGSKVVLPADLTDQTDWNKETYQTGVTQNYQASVSNASDKIKYFLSGGYSREDGVIKVAFFERYNMRANIDNQVRSWLNIGSNISYSDYTSNGVTTGQGANRGGVVLSAVNTPTYAPIWDPNNPGQYNENFYGANITHPVSNMDRTANSRNRTNRLVATGKGEITFIPELKFRSSITLDREAHHYTDFLDPIKTSYGRSRYGEGTDNRALASVIVFDNTLTFNKSFDKSSIDVMGGASYTTSDWSRSSQTVSHYFDSSIQTLNAGNKLSQSNGTTAAQWALMSYFGRVAYNFDSKYLVTLNMRADGSSKLHPDHRWGFFPSMSAAWRISSEGFMSDLSWIDDLKLRGGWGQTGNQSGLNDYGYLERYRITRVNWWEAGNEHALPTISQNSLRARDLTWETTTQSNIGFDFTVLSNRLTFNADFYYKKTTNMLMKVQLPNGASVANEINRNEGEMTNTGVEFSVNSVNITAPFSWETDFNISFNKNKLTKLSLNKIYYDVYTSDNLKEYAVRNEPGRPLGGFYGYISDGVDPETGELMYRDVNGDGVLSTSDRTYIGDPNPDFTFGITNRFSYKGLNLSILLQGSYGNDIFNASRMETEGMYDAKNQSKKVLDRWRIPGQITDVPKAGYNMKNSSYFVEDGSFLRVKDITLSYNVSVPLLKKWGINRLQPYVTASNLLTWTNYSGMDPEVNQMGGRKADQTESQEYTSVQGIDWGTYPQTKSFVFGVNVEF